MDAYHLIKNLQLKLMWRTLKSSKAFSLMELLVVLFLVAFLFVTISPRFVKKDRKIRKQFEKLIRLNRKIMIQSKIHNNNYRLVIQIDPKGPEQYWVEKEQIGQQNKEEDSLNEQDLQQEREEQEPVDPFFLDDSFFDEAQILFPILNITKVESSNWTEPKTEGLAYIYYYPTGLSQETAIHFLRPDNKGRWTLYLEPATKELHIYNKEKNLAK